MTPEALAEKFAQLVKLVQRDMSKLAAEVQQLKGEVLALKAKAGSGGGSFAGAADVDGEVVGFHPATGKPLKASDVNPRLAMQMRFSEDD